MLKTNAAVVLAVYLILRKGDQVLLSLRQNTGYADGLFGLVAGHLDGGENAVNGMRREIREEIGIDIPETDLKMKLTMHRLAPEREVIDLFFVAECTGEKIKNLEPNKCGGLEFHPFKNLPSNIIPYIREALTALERGDTYIECGWNDLSISTVS